MSLSEPHDTSKTTNKISSSVIPPVTYTTKSVNHIIWGDYRGHCYVLRAEMVGCWLIQDGEGGKLHLNICAMKVL